MRVATVKRASQFELVADKIAPDKSISHRSVMFAMLSRSQSRITNFLRAEDTLNSLNIIRHLGAEVKDDGDTILIRSDGIKEASVVLDCGNSGTGMRLFCGLLASADGHFVLSGDEYLCRRPMRRVTEPLRSIGAKLDGREGGEKAPLSIRGASIKAFNYTSLVSSAQVKSAMILAALRADAECSFSEPSLSRDHTELMLKGMGAQISTTNLTTTIKPLKEPLRPLDIRIPADPSSAFFFAVAAAITPNSSVLIRGVTLNKTRIEAFKVLEKMGADIEYIELESRYEPIGDIVVKYAPLKAVTVDSNIAWLIDELPALSIAFACADGVSVVKNAKELRVKESDRIDTVVTNLLKCGIEAKQSSDGYEIRGGNIREATVDSYGDHRIAMSFAIAGLRSGMIIEDTECIQTSFPNFFDLLAKIGGVNES